MEKMKMKSMVVAISLGMLSGCASIQKAENSVAENTDFSSKSMTNTQQKATQAAQDQTRGITANFGKVHKNWVNPNPLAESELFAERSKLPSFFKKPVTLTMPGKVSLVEVLSELQRVQNITFTIGQDVYNSTTGTGSLISSSTSAAPAAPTGTNNASLGTNGAVPIYVNDFVFRGSLESALDLMSSKANIAWKWNGNSVEVYRFETKSYNIAALAGKTTSSASVTIQGDSGTGDKDAGNVGNKATSGVNRSTDLNSWEDIRSYLLSMLSPSGSLAVMESAGIVTIKDTPVVQLRVAKAIKELNAVIGQQIFMDVNVYAVTLNDEDNYSLNWNLAWQTMSRNFGLNIVNAAPTVAGGNTISANVVRGPFTGSSVMAQALSTLGKTTIVNNFSFSTLNGQPTPVGNNRRITYVQSISSTPSTTQGVAPSVAIIPGVVYQGIGMSVTPRLQQGTDKLLLEYSLNLNDVENIQSFTSGSGASAQTIQLPTTTVKNILQRASLRSGQTLILSGFKQNTNSITKSGLGSANNQLFGGGNNGKNSSQYLVITVTPYVAQDNE